jgi:hypothetical protein
VICPACARAADRRAPADQHCDDPKCMCGHRTDRYQPAPEDDTTALAAKILTTWAPGTVCRDPRADDPAYDPITGYRTWDEVEADPPQFTGILATHSTDTTKD